VLPIRCQPGRRAGEVYREAAAALAGELIGLLSHPSWPADGQWFDTLAGYAMRAGTGAVAPKIVTTDGRIGFAGTLLGVGSGIAFPYAGQRQDVDGQVGRARLSQNFQALGGGFLLIERSKLDRVGGFDPEYAGATAAQIALCLALRDAGYWNVWVANKVLLTSRLPRYECGTEDLATLQRRWPAAFAADPAYHPALSRERLFEAA
jgi:GT2 family glycosyltransferase